MSICLPTNEEFEELEELLEEVDLLDLDTDPLYNLLPNICLPD